MDKQRIITTIQSVLPKDIGPVALHEPFFGGNEWNYVKECIDTRWVSSVGKFVDQFEQMLAETCQVNHAVAVGNGTEALHICLKLAGVTAHDEVLMPALTFVATANAVTYCNAIPHFVDNEERTLGMDPAALNDYLNEIAEIKDGECFNRFTGRRIKAVVPVHTFGHPVDLDPLEEVCCRFRLTLVEDAAESLGSCYKGKHTGGRGLLNSLSFNGNKVVTTGGGGAVLTNDQSLARAAKHITTTAKRPHSWEYYHDETGYNYRLPNINAALGCAQLEQLPEFIMKKRELARRYEEAFQSVEGVTFFREPAFARSNYWLNVLLLEQKSRLLRDEILQLAKDNGIAARPAWVLMNKLPMYEKCPRMELTVSEDLENRLINIPSSVYL